MKVQNFLIFALVFALIIAIFSVVNVDAVPVNFLFGQASIPLIIVIIASTLVGGIIVGAVGIFRQYSLQKEVTLLRKTVEQQLGQETLQDVDRDLNSEAIKSRAVDQQEIQPSNEIEGPKKEE